MIPSQRLKFLPIVFAAAAVNNAAVATTVIDTIGVSHVTIVVQLGATDAALTTLKVTESDTKTNDTTLTNPVDVGGTIFGTSKNSLNAVSTLPTATDDNKLYAIDIPVVGGRKRYLKLNATVGNGAAGAFISAVAILSRSQVTATTAIQRGFDQVLQVF